MRPCSKPSTRSRAPSVTRLRGEKALRAITVNYTPCGHCRQFMNELNSGLELRINLPGRAPHTLGDYLPDAFGPKDLEIKNPADGRAGPRLCALGR